MPQETLQKLKDEDKSALKELFDVYYTGLTRFALRLISDPMVAEEIVQDIFIYLWQNKNSLHINTSIEAYLFKAVKNKCINYTNSKIHQINKNTSAEETMEKLWVTESHMESDELPALIEKAINALPKQTSLIFTFSRNADLSYSEIAEKLNISKKTVEYHISSALKSIKKFLSSHGYTLVISIFLLFSYLINLLH